MTSPLRSVGDAVAAALLALVALVAPVAPVALVASASAASAADAPAPTASLGQVVVGADGTVSGSLTVPGGLDGGAAALTASIGTTTIPVSAQVVPPAGRGVVLVLDTGTQAGSPGLDTVRGAVDAYLDGAPGDLLVGVVGFDAAARVAVAPTVDRAAVRTAVGALVGRPGRTTYDALSVALTQLGAVSQRSVLLVTGGPDLGSAAPPGQVATSLRTAGVSTRVIAYRTSPADTTPLARLASDGTAGVTAVGDGASLTRSVGAASRTVTTQVRWSLRTGDSLSGSQRVQLSGSTGGVRFTATASLELGPAAVVTNAPPAALTTPPPSLAFGLPLTALLAVAAVGLALGAVVVALTAPTLSSRGSVRAREISAAFDAGPVDRDGPGVLAESVVAFGDRMMKDRRSTSRTVVLIERADLPLRAGEWWVVRVLSVVAFAVLGGFAFSRAIGAAAVVGALVGVLVPPAVLRWLAERRARAFEAQLPDVLTLVASSLQTGFSFLQSLDAVSRDVAQPAAKEFSRTMAETRIGADVDEALGRLAVRMRSRNMEITAMAVRIQRQVGGNLSETLRTTAATIRERQSLARHVSGLAAEGRLSTWILALMPVVIFLFTFSTNYDYVQVLWTTFTGVALLVYGGVSLVVGVLVMGRVSKVEV